ncbi:hypothetical protein NPIL_586271 [Nephila pilipes]|uniref:Uncharacterized protein n=1 Tax=Nephila pilipes TaxID=299642 RepID=A0A8X6M7G5_NEPPI|nr:hypothetical protein NPIL_586271 [Nephila pilipes]
MSFLPSDFCVSSPIFQNKREREKTFNVCHPLAEKFLIERVVNTCRNPWESGHFSVRDDVPRKTKRESYLKIRAPAQDLRLWPDASPIRSNSLLKTHKCFAAFCLSLARNAFLYVSGSKPLVCKRYRAEVVGFCFGKGGIIEVK